MASGNSARELKFGNEGVDADVFNILANIEVEMKSTMEWDPNRGS